MRENIKEFEPLWGEWKLEQKLGEGSYGSVWKAARVVNGKTEYVAIKEINVPSSEEIWQNSILEGLDEKSTRQYFQNILDNTLEEVELMKYLSDCEQVVQFQDVQVCNLNQRDNFGWVVFIQMELLIPLRKYMIESSLRMQDIQKIGIDICKALEVCDERGVVHQDLKPDNLFYDSNTNTYKLGDFGIAKQLGRSTAQKGRPGTLSYMSPEIYRGDESTSAMDLYALGMILYRILNHYRMPFLPPYPEPFTPDERDRALMERLKGGQPNPAYLNWIEQDDERRRAEILEPIVRKSILNAQEERYQNAQEFRVALEDIELL